MIELRVLVAGLALVAFGARPEAAERLQSLAREHGFTQTLFGRKTHFEPNIRSPNQSFRGGRQHPVGVPVRQPHRDRTPTRNLRQGEIGSHGHTPSRADRLCGGPKESSTQVGISAK